jgi:hypothetical protein
MSAAPQAQIAFDYSKYGFRDEQRYARRTPHIDSPRTAGARSIAVSSRRRPGL